MALLSHTDTVFLEKNQKKMISPLYYIGVFCIYYILCGSQQQRLICSPREQIFSWRVLLLFGPCLEFCHHHTPLYILKKIQQTEDEPEQLHISRSRFHANFVGGGD